MPAETVSDNVETLINLALAEDFGPGDVTSTYFVPEHLTARAILTPRKKGVLSGVNVAAEFGGGISTSRVGHDQAIAGMASPGRDNDCNGILQPLRVLFG